MIKNFYCFIEISLVTSDNQFTFDLILNSEVILSFFAGLV